MNDEKRNRQILDILYEMYPEARCVLNHSTPFELLVSTILSAQTTDKKVNEVTSRMFKKCSTPYEFAKLSPEELEKEIKEIGLYKTKSKNIINMSKILIERFNGEVPKTLEDLTSLPGVGRKTANVVMSNAFGIPALAVDTHVFRVSNRIGLADSNNVEGTEKQLTDIIAKELWLMTHHTLIFHGRRICSARKPQCSECGIKEYCRYFNNNMKDCSK